MAQRLTRPRPEVEAIIDQMIEKGQALFGRPVDFGPEGNFGTWKGEQERWNALAREALLSVYESDEPANEFWTAAVGGASAYMGYSSDPALELTERVREVNRGINTLVSFKERLDFAEAPAPAEPVVVEPATMGRGTFLVHGHNEELKQTVARFLDHVTEAGALVLAEQPDAGRTHRR